MLFAQKGERDIEEVFFIELSPGVPTNETVIYFPDIVEFRTKAIFEDVQFPGSTTITDTIYHHHSDGIDTSWFTNKTKQVPDDTCTCIIIPSNDSMSGCWDSKEIGRIQIPLQYGLNKITFTTFQSATNFFVSDDTLFIYHPMPQVVAGTFSEILPDSIQQGTLMLQQTFNSAVNFQAQLTINDTLSFDESISMVVFLDDEIIDNILAVSNLNDNIIVPANINENSIELPDYEPHYIYYKAFFTDFPGGNDSLVYVSDSLYVQRKKPAFIAYDFVDDTPGIDTAQLNTFFDDTIEFKLQFTYDDNVNSGDSIEVTVRMNETGNPIPFYEHTETGITQLGSIITIPGSDFFTIPLDPLYNINLELCFEAKFFREDEQLASLEICDDPVIIYHPAPAVDLVKYYAWEPANIDTSGIITATFFDEYVKFQSLIYYNDPFSNEEQINLQAYLDGEPYGEVYSDSTNEENFPECLIPSTDSIAIDLPDYEEHTIHFCAYFDNEYPDPEKCSDTLHVKRLKPEVVNFEYLNPYPENLFADGWQTVYTDSIRFRTKLWYNDSININDSIQLIAMREIYSEGQIESVDTAYSITIERESHPDSLYLMIPPENEERLIIPLEDRYDSILVYFQARFIRDLLDADTFFSCNTDTLKIIHPAPEVKELLYQTSIGKPSNEIIAPAAPTAVFDTVVQVRMQINYDDTCSVKDEVILKAYFNGDLYGQQLFDSTRVWGEGSIFMPRMDSSLFNFPLQYGDSAGDYDSIHFEAYFTKTSGSIVSSDSLFIYRAKPIIESHQFIPVLPSYLGTVNYDSIYHDEIEFDLQLDFNDNQILGDSIKTVVYREIIGGNTEAVDSLTQSKPTEGNSITFSDFTVTLDPYFDDSIRVFFKSWFIRNDLPNPEIYNNDGEYALLMFHPKPKVNTISFSSFVSPDTLYVNEPDGNKFVFNDTLKFKAQVMYKDTFSLEEEIWVQAWKKFETSEPIKFGDSIRITLGNNNELIFPENGLFIDTLGYNFGDYRYYLESSFYLDDTITLDIVTSDTLYLSHPIPEIDTVKFELDSPNNLIIGVQGANTEVYEDTIKFRAVVEYNDPLSQVETIKARVMKIYDTDTVQQGGVLDGVTSSGNELIIPVNQEVFNVPLDYEFGDHEIYIEAWFDLVGVTEKDTMTSASIYLNHPKPKVEETYFQEFIYPDTLYLDDPTANRLTFEDSITFIAKVEYNDNLSSGEVIKVQAWKKYDGDFEMIQEESRETQGNNSTEITIPASPTLFDIQLDYDFGEHEIFLVSWFELEGVPQVEKDTSLTVYLFHPKPTITSIEYQNLEPIQLYSYLNTEIEIYNDSIAFEVKLAYNDSLSVDENIRMDILHYYYQDALPVTDTLTLSAITALHETAIEFPKSAFGISQYDFAYHKFQLKAWFDESFTEVGDILSSDLILLSYRENTPPYDLQVITLFDTIYTEPEYLLKGFVKDTTGNIKKITIFDGIEKYAIDNIQQDGSTWYWSFTRPFNSGSIFNFSLETQDSVNFIDSDEFLWTERPTYTRLVYASLDANNPQAYLPKDSSFRVYANPVGGKYSSNEGDFINSAGILNPVATPPGEYTLSYTLGTTTDEATLSYPIEILQPCEIFYGRPEQIFWKNSKDWYWVGQCNNGNFLKAWNVIGGKILEAQGDSVYVEWTEGSTGELQTRIEAIYGGSAYDYDYTIQHLVAVDGLAPEKPTLTIRGDASNGYILFSSVNDTENYDYTWFKDGEIINENDNQPYIFIGSENIEGGYYVKITDRLRSSYTESDVYFY